MNLALPVLCRTSSQASAHAGAHSNFRRSLGCDFVNFERTEQTDHSKFRRSSHFDSTKIICAAFGHRKFGQAAASACAKTRTSS